MHTRPLRTAATTLLIAALTLTATACATTPEPQPVALSQLSPEEADAIRCAPRCVCGPPGEYTWCCDRGGRCPIPAEAIRFDPEQPIFGEPVPP